MTNSMQAGLGRENLEHSARTMVVATASLAIARLVWTSGSAVGRHQRDVVTQSTMGTALTISGERFAGTALGATAGALLGTYLGSSIFIFAAGIFGLGLVCGVLRLDRAAYRFAGITLAGSFVVRPHRHCQRPGHQKRRKESLQRVLLRAPACSGKAHIAWTGTEYVTERASPYGSFG